jgi:hypothetical protein
MAAILRKAGEGGKQNALFAIVQSNRSFFYRTAPHDGFLEKIRFRLFLNNGFIRVNPSGAHVLFLQDLPH